MLGWRKKRKSYPPRHEIAVADAWDVAIAESEDGPMVFRINRGVEPLVGHPEYPYQVGVATLLKAPNENGHHTDEEGGQLGAIEDALIEAFEADKQGLFVVTNCVAGTKEWVFYANDPEAIKTRFHEVRGRTITHDLQLLIREDRPWDVYASFGG